MSLANAGFHDTDFLSSISNAGSRGPPVEGLDV
jgi:hypothetical protein